MDPRRSTALAWAALRNNSEPLAILLDYGADIEIADCNGDTALMESLFFNSDDSLKLLLERGADYSKTDSYGDPFLHDVAIYGGLGTIDVVADAKFKRLDIHALNKKGKTALELAREREVKPEGFVEAFEQLLANLKAWEDEACSLSKDGGDSSSPQPATSPNSGDVDCYFDALEE